MEMNAIVLDQTSDGFSKNVVAVGEVFGRVDTTVLGSETHEFCLFDKCR